MRFKDEFKEEMQKLSPTEEQRERIRNGVMKRISEDSAPIPSKKKKPLYLKIAAISGTAVCAAAIAVFAIAGVRGNFIKSNGINCTEGNNGNTGGAYDNDIFSAESISNGGMNDAASAPLDHDHSGSSNSGTDTKYSGSNTSVSKSDDSNIFYESNTSGGKDTDSDGVPSDSSPNANTGGPGDDTSDNIPTGGGTDSAANGGPTTGGGEDIGGNINTGGMGDSLYFQFSEDRSHFRTIIENETHYFALTGETRDFSPENAETADSNFGEPLFIQREGSFIAVFRGDESFVGVYKMTS